MAIIQTAKKTKKDRYDGTDPGGWKLSYTTPPPLGAVKGKDASFSGYRDAQAAADQYIAATGLHAGAVRV